VDGRATIDELIGEKMANRPLSVGGINYRQIERACQQLSAIVIFGSAAE
jgi:hypothetical protein